MNLLALDTSSNACSVALQVGDSIFEKHVVEPREHTKILVPMIEALLREADTRLSELDAVVLGNGPGSFIGMRIGASVAQGLSHGAGIKIVPVSSLAAIAAEVICEHDAQNVLVAQDARMYEVYIGRYRRSSDGLPVAVVDDSLKLRSVWLVKTLTVAAFALTTAISTRLSGSRWPVARSIGKPAEGITIVPGKLPSPIPYNT